MTLSQTGCGRPSCSEAPGPAIFTCPALRRRQSGFAATEACQICARPPCADRSAGTRWSQYIPRAWACHPTPTDEGSIADISTVRLCVQGLWPCSICLVGRPRSGPHEGGCWAHTLVLLRDEVGDTRGFIDFEASLYEVSSHGCLRPSGDQCLKSRPHSDGACRVTRSWRDEKFSLALSFHGGRQRRGQVDGMSACSMPDRHLIATNALKGAARLQ